MVSRPSVRGGVSLAWLVGSACATAPLRNPADSRPLVGPGTDWVVAAPGGDVGLCALQDGPMRICGWATPERAGRWVGAVERLMRQPAGTESRSTPELSLSDGIAIHVVRNRVGAIRPFQVVLSDGRRHLAAGAPLTEDGGADFVARLREAIARAQGRGTGVNAPGA